VKSISPRVFAKDFEPTALIMAAPSDHIQRQNLVLIKPAND